MNCFTFKVFKTCLEIITPIRGRKLTDIPGLYAMKTRFRNNNPDKGTETILLNANAATSIKFLKNNPDKGP